MSEPILIDGSTGEGGGQVLRTSLSLSMLTGNPFQIINIRARRRNPGLQPQHLAAVQAAAKISQASVEGAAAGSQSITFHPGKIRHGKFHFSVGTAGSVTLVLQTILLPLCLSSQQSSTVTISGGTHVPWSPSFHYLDLHWLPYLRLMGARVRLTLEKAGYYPAGGGQITAAVQPGALLQPICLVERGSSNKAIRIYGISGVSNLDMDIATRQKHQALRRLQSTYPDARIKSMEIPAFGKGSFLILLAEFEKSRACYGALGAKGKRAEQVADEACDALEKMLAGPAAVDEYLADQLLLPMALAKGESQLFTARVTGHLLTNAAIIHQFLSGDISIQGEFDQPGMVSVRPGL